MPACMASVSLLAGFLRGTVYFLAGGLGRSICVRMCILQNIEIHCTVPRGIQWFESGLLDKDVYPVSGLRLYVCGMR